MDCKYYTKETFTQKYAKTNYLLFLNVNIQSLRERKYFLEIFKIQVDDIILPWVADGIPMYWWVPIS